MDIEWYYAFYKEQRGPVTEAEFNRLVDAGVIGPETLVWKAGMDNWEPYEQVLRREEAARPAAGDESSRTDANFEDEGVPSTTEDTGASIDLGDTFDSVWACLKANLGAVIGGTLVAGVMVVVLTIVNNIAPWLGFFLGLAVTGPIMGGYMYYLLQLLRDRHVTVGDMFQRMSERFGHLCLAHVVPWLLGFLLPFLPGGILSMLALWKHGLFKQAFENVLVSATQNFTPLMGIAVLFLLVGVIVNIYLQVCWSLTIPLVADRNISFWSAMKLSFRAVSRRFWSMFVLVFLMNIVASIAGLAMCCVGLVVTIPFYVLLVLDAYETLFSRRPE